MWTAKSKGPTGFNEANYDDHFSSMNPILEVPNFFQTFAFVFRGFYEYVLLDFNVGSISLLVLR